MIAAIVLFGPAVLANWCYEALSKTSLSRKNWFCLYILHLIVINFLCFAVKSLLLHSGAAPLWTLAQDMTPSVAFHYLIMALPLSGIVPVISCFFKKNVKVSMEDESHEE